MTYNIRGGLGLDRRRDIARVAGVVANGRPDVVCYQEVHRWLPWGGWTDQPRLLRKMTGMSFVFQATVRLGVGGEGLGIASRFPIRRVQRHRLPGGRERRGLLAAEVQTADGLITVFCSHWGLSHAERVRQAQATAAHLRAAGTPIVFCADLNDSPVAGYVTAMREEAGLCDCGAATARPTYPSDAPTSRIDVVFASAMLRVERLSVIDTRASDHRPVVADLCWRDEVRRQS